MHDPVSPLRVFDEGSWLFRQMVQAQPFIRQSGMVLAELGLLLVVVRHNYDWWLFKLGPRGRLYIPFD